MDIRTQVILYFILWFMSRCNKYWFMWHEIDLGYFWLF